MEYKKKQLRILIMRTKGFYIVLILSVMLCGLSLMIINADKPQAPERVERAYYIAKSTITPTPSPTATPTATPTPADVYAVYNLKVMCKESLGSYFITAYCPSECGYNGNNYPTGWRTASGAICHRSDFDYRYSDPTTCAIDRKMHSFGDLFYIAEFDRVFVAEDTGSAVKNKHLDLFYIDYSDVLSFPTGYYEVYSVYYEEITLEVIKGSDIPLINEVITEEDLEELYQLEEVR